MKSSSNMTKICVVRSPSFSRCFNPFMIQSNPLSHFIVDENEYISSLRKRVESLGLPWLVEPDNTYADAKEIKDQGFDIIIVTPGLKLLFARRGFDKRKVVHLDYFSYATQNVNVAIRRIKEAIQASEVS